MTVWSREDEAIRDDVIAELESEPELPEPARVGVSVREGVVTLTGSVSSYPQRMAAERAARRVDGVRAVANDIEVKLTKADCQPGGSAKNISYKAKYCVLIQIGMSVSAQDLVINENSQLMFSNLEYTEG